MAVFELCIDSPSAALAAATRVDRLEYCARLDLGGVTPDFVEWVELQADCSIPVFAMIRPRGGSFVHDEAELDQMERSILEAQDLGVPGLVFGVLDDRRRVNARAMHRLMEAATGTPVTFHRAFDEVAEPAEALETLIELGVARLLTTGGPATAWEGRERLRELVELAGERLIVMPGGGVRQDHVRELIAFTGAREVHSSVVLELD